MQYIHSFQRLGTIPGLERIGRLMDRLHNPQNSLKFIHIAGTNGKGSTAAMINSILIAAGYKTGLYTSPSLHCYHERIRVCGRMISDEDFERIVWEVKREVDRMLQDGYESPTEFELMTAIGFQYFYEQQCDVVILETGLGGRYDATNIIDTPLLSVITSISYDHMESIGDTLPKIAYQKVGIIKEGGQTLLYPTSYEVETVVKDMCREKGNLLTIPVFDLARVVRSDLLKTVFDYRSYRELTTHLLGDYQVKNAIMAIEAISLLKIRGLSISEEALRQGLASVNWGGRFELIHHSPTVLIDGAHNKDGVETLARSLKGYFENKKITFIVGMLKDKEYISMIRTMLPLAKRFLTITPDSPRSLTATTLAKIIREEGGDAEPMESVDIALETALHTSEENDVICVFGSLYYLAQVREFFHVVENQ